MIVRRDGRSSAAAPDVTVSHAGSDMGSQHRGALSVEVVEIRCESTLDRGYGSAHWSSPGRPSSVEIDGRDRASAFQIT